MGRHERQTAARRCGPGCESRHRAGVLTGRQVACLQSRTPQPVGRGDWDQAARLRCRQPKVGAIIGVFARRPDPGHDRGSRSVHPVLLDGHRQAHIANPGRPSVDHLRRRVFAGRQQPRHCRRGQRRSCLGLDDAQNAASVQASGAGDRRGLESQQQVPRRSHGKNRHAVGRRHRNETSSVPSSVVAGARRALAGVFPGWQASGRRRPRLGYVQRQGGLPMHGTAHRLRGVCAGWQDAGHGGF